MTKVSKVRKSEAYNWFYLAERGDEKVFKKPYKNVYMKVYRWNGENMSRYEIMPGSIDNKVKVRRVQ